MPQLSLTIAFSVLLAFPFLWVWRIKHPSRSLLKEYACFLTVLYGIPLVTGFFLGNMLDFNASALTQLFRLDPQTSTGLAKITVGFMAALISLLPVYMATKTIQTPVASPQKLREGALAAEPELSHHRSA